MLNSPQSFEGESFVWTLSFGCGVSSVSAKELLTWEEFLSVQQSLQWFLCSSSPQDNQHEEVKVYFKGKNQITLT